MQNLLRLWFCINLATGTSWVEGPDTKDLAAVDSSYPLVPGKVLASSLSMEQMDVLSRIKIMNPLRKKVLDDLQRLIHSNKPQYWITVYLCTFILLHTCSVVTADRYRHARKHGSSVSAQMSNYKYPS
jgi:hypothetical protein